MDSAKALIVFGAGALAGILFIAVLTSGHEAKIANWGCENFRRSLNVPGSVAAFNWSVGCIVTLPDGTARILPYEGK